MGLILDSKVLVEVDINDGYLSSIDLRLKDKEVKCNNEVSEELKH